MAGSSGSQRVNPKAHLDGLGDRAKGDQVEVERDADKGSDGRAVLFAGGRLADASMRYTVGRG